jgi:Bacterial Ig-like domain
MSDAPGAPAEGRALRAPGSGWRDLPEGLHARVVRIDPPDGARGVFRDTPIVASFSRPADPRTVSGETFLVMDEDGAVPGGVWTSLDGRVAIFTPARSLRPGALHAVRLAGLRDLRGRELSVHESAFVPGLLALGDLGP